MGYSPERRSAVLKRMLPPNNMAIRQLAQEEGISAATLHKCVRRRSGKGQLLPDAACGPRRLVFAGQVRGGAGNWLNEADMAEYSASAGCFRRRSRPGVWPASRRMTGTVRARRVLARRPRKRRGGSRIWNALDRALAETAALPLFCEKRHQRSGGTERTHDQHPRSPNRHCPDQ